MYHSRSWASYDAVDWAPACPQPINYIGTLKVYNLSFIFIFTECLIIIETPINLSIYNLSIFIHFYNLSIYKVRGKGKCCKTILMQYTCNLSCVVRRKYVYCS